MKRDDFTLTAICADDGISPALRAALQAPGLDAVLSAAFSKADARFAPRHAQVAERPVAKAPWLDVFYAIADEPLSAEEVAEADEYLRREMEASDDRLDYPEGV